MKKLLLLTLFLGGTLLSWQGIAQSSNQSRSGGKASGRVVDETGEPIAGATVIMRKTDRGVITGANGEFSITVPRFPAALSVSFLGYGTELTVVNSPSDSVVVTLKAEATTIDDVVVVGYGTLKQSDIATSVSSIREKDLANQNLTSLEQALQGMVAGVSVVSDSGEPGGGISVSVRGLNSLTGNGQPLYVIDGIPLNIGAGADGDENNVRDNPMAFLNPDDVSSIDVLKDAAATAIYGSRGSNGVILITTKQSEAGKAKVDFTTRVTYSRIGNPLDLLNAWDYAALRNYALHLFSPNIPLEQLQKGNNYYSGPVGSARPHPDNILSSTNWADHVMRDTWSQVYQLNVSGGTAKNSYLTGFNYTNNQGIVINSQLQKFNFKVSMKNTILPKVTLRTNLNYTYTIRDKAFTSVRTAQDGVINNIIRQSPLTPLTVETDAVDENGEYVVNPYIQAKNTEDRSWMNDLLGSVELTWEINKNLSLTGRSSGNYHYSKRDIYYPLNTRRGKQSGGMAFKNNAENANIVNEIFFNYQKRFGKDHSLNAVLGGSYEFFQRKAFNTTYQGLDFMDLGMDALAIAKQRNSVVTLRETSVLASGFVRLNYNYDRRYLVSLITRADGSSKFGTNNKWGFFPSAAVAWNFSNEKFMKGTKKVLSNGKLRLSYGIVGNQSLGNYNSLQTYTITNAPFNGTSYNIARASRLANPDLKWETTESINAAIDLSFIKDKLSVTFEAYRNSTRDLLYNRTIAASSGFQTMWQNIGSIRNTGYEVEIMAYPVNKKNFSYNTRLNLSHNKGIVTSLGGDPEMFTSNVSNNLFADPSHVLRPGMKLGSFYGFRVDGLIQIDDFVDYMNGNRAARTIEVGGVERPAFIPMQGAANVWAGSWKYVDADNDGAFTEEDKTVIGNAQPDLVFGWTHNFTIFKHFEVSIFLQGAIGHQLMNVTRGWIGSGWATGNPSYDYYENMWTLENQHNNVRYPAFGAAGKAPTTILRVSDALIEDADYVKLKSLTLRYTFPQSMISKIGIRKLSIFVTGGNLLTLTKYSGFDPEVGSGGTALKPGIDNQAYPRPRTVTFGLNLGF